MYGITAAEVRPRDKAVNYRNVMYMGSAKIQTAVPEYEPLDLPTAVFEVMGRCCVAVVCAANSSI